MIFFFCVSNKSYVSVDIVGGSNSFNSKFMVNNQVIDDFEEKAVDDFDTKEWKIRIPKIELDADISEGTSESVLDYFVGHFSETSFWNGNVGLAAHNRGYNVNYFSRIKELETGDEIIYVYKGKVRKYIVDLMQIIKETDWSLLEETDDNRITLITCVENKPEYRRCIQALENKEE